MKKIVNFFEENYFLIIAAFVSCFTSLGGFIHGNIEAGLGFLSAMLWILVCMVYKESELKRKKKSTYTEEEKMILCNIGHFYVHKYIEKNKDGNLEKAYKDAYDELKILNIKRIIVKENTIILYTNRPGILIGAKGSNIEALEHYLENNKINKKIKIVEERLDDHLFPMYPDLD